MLNLTRRKSKKVIKPELRANNLDTSPLKLRLLPRLESSSLKLLINSIPEDSSPASHPDQDNQEDAMVTFLKEESLNSTLRNSRERRSE
jgi:hypothetical protein